MGFKGRKLNWIGPQLSFGGWGGGGSFKLNNLSSSRTRGTVEALTNELQLEVFDSILLCY